MPPLSPTTLRLLHLQQQLSLLAPAAEAHALSTALSSIDAQRRTLHDHITHQHLALSLHAHRLPTTRRAQILAAQQALYTSLVNYIDDLLSQDAALASQAHALSAPLLTALSTLALGISRIRATDASHRRARHLASTAAERRLFAQLQDLFTYSTPTP
jgi:hypothetical protein